MTKNLKVVTDSMKSDDEIIFLSYSVTPWIDKPYILKKYCEKNAINNTNWYFLTGSRDDIYSLARQSYFAEEDIGFSKDSKEFLHTEHFVLVDRNKHIRGIYNGTLLLEMQHLIDDINALKREE
jgi:protein SCO1